MDVGALSLLISEKGFDSTMAKVAALDQAAAKVGAKPVDVRVTAAQAPVVLQSLQQVSQAATAISSTPVQFRFNIPAVQQASAALTQTTTATTQAAQASQALGAAAAIAATELKAAAVAAQQAAAASTAQATASQQAAQATAQQAAAAQVQVTAVQQNTAAVGALITALQSANTRTATLGNTAQVMTPKVRSASNALSIIAFAAATGEGSLRGMTAAAGLATSALLEAFGPASVAVYASGIGAAVVALGTLIAILHDAAQAAKPAEDVLKHFGNIDRISSAQAAVRGLDADIARLQTRVASGAGAGFLDRFFMLPGNGRTFSQFMLDALGLSSKDQRELEAKLAAREALIDRYLGPGGLANEQRKAVASATREAAVSAAQDQLLITSAYLDRNESLNQQAYALGQVNLENYFATRETIAKERSAAAIAALKAERDALASGPVDEKPDEALQRDTRRKAVIAAITAEEVKGRTAEQQFMAEREAAERALAQRLAGFERQRMEAQGQTHEARMQQIAQEAEEYQRALATDPTKDAGTKAALVNALRTALTLQEQYNEAQRESGRIFAEMAAERERIQRRVDAGQTTEAEGNREIAEAERKRIPGLVKIAASMEDFATKLNNPELLAAAKRLRGEIEGMARTPLGPLAQRIKAVMDELSLAAAEGDRGAAGLLTEIQRDIDRNGGKITVGIAVKAEWLLNLKRQIEEQSALLEINLKPKNIVLSGVDQALGQLNQQLSGLATNVGSSIGNALADGFSSAFTKGSGKSFFEAAGNSILAGIGSMMVQLGSAMLTYGLIMAVAAPLLVFTPFAQQALSAPAAILAGTALIAAGAGMGAIAANNTGHRTGGGASASRSANRQATEIPAQHVILDPDRRLREARAVAPTVAPRENARATPAAQPFVFAPTIIGTNDPKAVRDIGDMVNTAWRRNLLKLT